MTFKKAQDTVWVVMDKDRPFQTVHVFDDYHVAYAWRREGFIRGYHAYNKKKLKAVRITRWESS